MPHVVFQKRWATRVLYQQHMQSSYLGSPGLDHFLAFCILLAIIALNRVWEHYTSQNQAMVQHGKPVHAYACHTQALSSDLASEIHCHFSGGISLRVKKSLPHKCMNTSHAFCHLLGCQGPHLLQQAHGHDLPLWGLGGVTKDCKSSCPFSVAYLYTSVRYCTMSRSKASFTFHLLQGDKPQVSHSLA